MIKHNRKGESAGAMASLLIKIMVVVCLITACQPTPDEAVVINKYNNAMEDVIAATPAPETSQFTVGDTEGESTNMAVSEHWIDSVSSNLTTIDIDADILVPDVSSYPIFQVEPIEIDETTIKKFIDVLAKDAVKIYNNSLLTKEDCESTIIRLKKEIADLEAGIIPPDDKRSADEQIEELEQQLAYFENEYNELERTGELSNVPLNYTFKPILGNESESMLLITAQMEDGSLYTFQCNKTDYGGVKHSSICFYRKNDGKPMASDEAIKLAAENIQRLDIGDFDFGFEENRGLHFCKSLDGIPMQCMWKSEGASGGATTEQEYSYSMGEESISVQINDKGIFYLNWDSPCSVMRTVNENVELQSIEQIKQTFKKQILYNIFEADGNENKILITKVRLEYMVMPEKDNLLNFRVIPVWNFIGMDKGEDADISKESGIEVNELIYLTVNAIDGTIVDRDLGY